MGIFAYYSLLEAKKSEISFNQSHRKKYNFKKTPMLKTETF